MKEFLSYENVDLITGQINVAQQQSGYTNAFS